MTGVMKNSVVKIVIALIIAMMVFAYMPMMGLKVHAEDKVIGKLNDTSYTSFEQLRNDLENNYENKSVTIEMLTDWQDSDEDITKETTLIDWSYKGKQYDFPLYIPEGCNATLNMNGHVFDRRIDKKKEGGYNPDTDTGVCISMHSNSKITINGGDNSKEHRVGIFTGYDYQKDYSNDTKQYTNYSGAVLSGAYRGIYMNKGSQVVVNDVSIVGCGLANSRPGGGIFMEKGSTLEMNNSSIEYCATEDDGGAIFTTRDGNNKIVLNNTAITNNWAGSEGGGIDIDGENTQIIGDGNSSVSQNHAKSHGGGIYAWNDEQTVKGLIIEGNETEKNGGGICTVEEDVLLENLIVKNNKASKNGGGIYIENDVNTLNNCEVRENTASGLGNGVYVEADVDEDFWLKGKTIIEDNNGSNLYIGDTDCDDTEVEFELSEGSEIWIAYHDGNHDKVKVSYHSGDYSKYLHSDQDGYYFTYQDGKTLRLRGNPNTASVFGGGNAVILIIAAAAILIVAMGAIKLSKKR